MIRDGSGLNDVDSNLLAVLLENKIEMIQCILQFVGSGTQEAFTGMAIEDCRLLIVDSIVDGLLIVDSIVDCNVRHLCKWDASAMSSG